MQFAKWVVNGVPLDDFPIHDEGPTVTHKGRQWRMTPRAILEGEHDGLIRALLYRWRHRIPDGWEEDFSQACRIKMAHAVQTYDPVKSSPASYLGTTCYWTLKRCLAHAKVVHQPHWQTKKGYTPVRVVGASEGNEWDDDAWDIGVVQDPRPDPEEACAVAEVAERMLQRIDQLPERLWLVLWMTLGPEVCDPRRTRQEGLGWTYGRAGDALCLSRERVRQLRVVALQWVRSGLPVDSLRKPCKEKNRPRMAKSLKKLIREVHVAHLPTYTAKDLARTYGHRTCSVERPMRDLRRHFEVQGRQGPETGRAFRYTGAQLDAWSLMEDA